MANYYYVTIKSDKMTQEVANQIFQEMATKNKIRSFNFSEGYLAYNSRGLTDISEILDKTGFTDEEVEVKDEFTYAYENMMQPDEAVIKDIEKIIKDIERFKERTNITDELKNIENILITLIEESNKDV